MELLPHADLMAMLARSGLIIKIVMAILLVLSVASWSLIFYKLLQLWSAIRSARTSARAFEQARDLEHALDRAVMAPDSCTARMAAEAVNEMRRMEGVSKGSTARVRMFIENVRHILILEKEAQIERLHGALPLLSTCASVAPLLGLFGTVWGIMNSFHSYTRPGLSTVEAVAPGLAEALVTTAFGLVVAIPAVLAYNLFMKMLSRVDGHLTRFGRAFMDKVKAGLPAMMRTKSDADRDAAR